jgi:nicotinate phosphoribosyltransferase
MLAVCAGLDENAVGSLLSTGAPVDGFGIGTALTTSSDAPALDCAYKIQEYAGAPRRKRSTGKATWPGRKQVWRAFDSRGRMTGDIVGLESGRAPGTPLIEPVMRAGTLLRAPQPIGELRARTALSLASLPERLRELGRGPTYPVEIASSLRALAEACDRQSR